ncbi:HelD family protein [Paenibacillus sp. 1001270B_150601_E10]|uniref:HelD family protein n=1 Tax=Paenibacillus sp. 1001270B_150601_E10 TaxID=2787079 RepID=UPI0018A0EF32|nr:3'-5' exonuclease [Paenibacillus sp. 1001270B_150601_E10]
MSEERFQSAYQEEEERLEQTLLEIKQQFESLQAIPVYRGSDFTEQVLEDNREQRRQRLKRAIREPYFGRMDIQEDAHQVTATPLYIGKQGVDAEETDLEQEGFPKNRVHYPMVIDWRAPVASMFYSFTGGEAPAVYEAPEGPISAHVHLKRNLVIRNEQLQRVVDTYNREQGEEHVTDEFLVYRLGENKDNRLRDIVSTIQAEQDIIIRSPKNKALFIQGVAGSGKTTVALHRLAFLLYQYQELIRAERMIIFAPNRMFLNYISEVLPELGVGNIQQRTFADWALQFAQLEDKIILASSFDDIERWYGSLDARPKDSTPATGRVKGSVAWKLQLDRFVDRWVEDAIPDVEFVPWEGAVLSQETISQWFNEEYRSYEPAKRILRVQARIQRWLEMELKKERSRTLLSEKKKKSSQKLKTYMKKWPKTEVTELYKQFLQEEDYSGLLPAKNRKQTVSDLKKAFLQHEDLASLVYLYIRLNGVESADRFDHIVIDEAQDFSPLQIALLDRLTKNHSFTILGDLSQGIHAYAGIEDWKEMMELFHPEECSYHALTRSYRSTMEIIHFANQVLKRGIKTALLAEPVFRSGQKVAVVHQHTKVEQWLMNEIQRHHESGYQTTAILTRTMQEAKEWHEQLQSSSVPVHLIQGKEQQYEGGISILPVYLSKGLEFDSVILLHVNESHYHLNPMEARLLYVGCTRALHQLTLLVDGTLSPLLAEVSDEWAEHVHA